MRLATAAALFVVGVAVAFASGITFDSGITRAAVILVSAALALTVLIRVQNRRSAALALGALILVLGFTRAAFVSGADASDWRNVPADGDRIVVSGWLSQDAARAQSGVRLHLSVENIDGEPADFPLTVFASGLSDSTGSGRASTGFRYGDVYQFNGEFSTSDARFARESAGTLFSGVVSLVASDRGNFFRREVGGFREWVSEKLAESMSEPASALARTMLVNDRTGISESLSMDFRESGTSHILAISGLHVALIGGLAMTVAAAAFGRRGQYYLIIPFVVTLAYASMAGFSPSVTRAAIMFSVALLARAVGRQNASLPGIGLAAAIMVAISPGVLNSLSFQLSFAAIAGISILTPRLLKGAVRFVPGLDTDDEQSVPYARPLAAGFAVSIAATLATWPLVAASFGGAPVWGGLATLVMLPAVPLLIVISALTSVVAGISAPAGEILGWPAWLLGEFIAQTAGIFSDVPPGLVETPGWGTGTAVIAYIIIGAAFSWRSLKAGAAKTFRWLQTTATAGQVTATPGIATRGVPAWSLAVAGLIAAVAWTGAFTAASTGDLSVTFFETDRGDMILIRTPNGNTALVDGGRDPLGAVRKLDSATPFWDRSIDLMLATHPDADHIGGLQPVIERYNIGIIAEAQTGHTSTVHAAWRTLLEERDDVIQLERGAVIALDDDISLEILAAGRSFPDAPLNDASVVAMLRYGRASILLTGDITSITERRLVGSGADVRATVLKVPHHGSDTSTTELFLSAVTPEIAVVQVGTDNRFGHPTDDVLGRLRAFVPENRIFVTRERGDVTVVTDGNRLRVEAAR